MDTRMRLKSFSVMEDDKPGVFWASFRYQGKPYCARWETEDYETFEEIADALSHCWDIAWAKVKEDYGE